ncbi:MAG: hypothetical protein O8C67_00275 [Candidatus Methanoperedens sp.]|nr:hypothetical protein [Candidatus Methanoperedens sp.]
MTAPTEKIFGAQIGAFVVYGKDGATLVPLKVNADGELVVNLEAATVNIGDVDILSIAAGTNLIGKCGIDQVTANANEVVVKTLPAITGAVTVSGTATVTQAGFAYKGKDRTTTTGAAEELTIPANSKIVLLSCAPSSQAYVELNDNATTGSPLYLEDPFGPLILDLGSVTKLSAYVVAGNIGAVFFG